MSRSWKIQAITACSLLVLMFAAVGARYAWTRVEYSPQEETRAAQTSWEPYWATVMQNAPIFEGRGMYTPMVGMARYGEGVQVLHVDDGYARVWHYKHQQPVYISAEYLDGVY